MMTDALERLRATKLRADAAADDLAMMERYVADRRDSGKWTEQDADEYRAVVTEMLRIGPESDRIAAREFWTSVLGCPGASGINDRIKRAIATKENAHA